ncbi:MAG: serine/threonine protein kinase [Candidatus Heimdallarchaeota archaeon]|nr:serine/threonine protein kinase [Candidatus Heimdallarchaeota archaeon]
MSKAAKQLLELDKTDFRILQVIEVGMRTAEYVSVDDIVALSRIGPNIIINCLDKLHYKELIFRWKGAYIGYQLTHHGYDVLAFRVLSERDSVIALGQELGKGKESDVLIGYDEDENELVVKIHRVGRPSFTRSKKLRGYIGGRGHINWLYRSRLSAQREYEGLKKARAVDAKVPQPIDANRHVIVMNFFNGLDLVDFPYLEQPEKLFNDIISELQKLVVEGGIIHGDLSEYNILITEEEDFLLIDFPQFVAADHPNARELLKRDVRNICNFFKKRYRVYSDPEEIVSIIMEEYETLHLKEPEKSGE